MKRIHRLARKTLRRYLGLDIDAARHEQAINETKILIARTLLSQRPSEFRCLADAEFKVFSQFGDDGIIQYLIRQIPIEPQTFIEFGVETYGESNTRFLLTVDNWKGLVIDGSQDHVDFIKNDDIYWRHDLTAVCSFITTENINETFRSNGFEGEIGLLSIDIDGNDYHVWEAINAVNPVLVIVEYNSLFGIKDAVTVPYDPGFSRMNAHYSGLYAGASLKALCMLASQKGYAFIGCNSAGNNAYFVRRDKLGRLNPLTAEEGYVESRVRESRDAQGVLTAVGGRQRLELIKHMPVWDVERSVMCRIADLWNPSAFDRT